MNSREIKGYGDFVSTLLDVGFSMGGGNSEGIFSVIPWNWKEVPPYETPVSWHTGNPETDPWEWRIRVLDERKDIAYSKLFFKKSGYITKEWAPYFLAVRRENRTLMRNTRKVQSVTLQNVFMMLLLKNGTLPLTWNKAVGRLWERGEISIP